MDNQPIETKNYRKPKMTKKKKIAIISSVSASLLLCVCAVVFWFLHQHMYNNWQTVKAPTCTENGEEMCKCFCGETETRVVLARHTEVIDKGYAATKTTDGLTDGIRCGVCNEIIKTQERIYAIGSQGLTYTATANRTCQITGIGTCTDTEIVIPNYIEGRKVTSIYGVAFFGCESITSITIPENVVRIGDDALRCCSGLKNITVSKDNISYKSIDGVLLKYDERTLVCYPVCKQETEYAIPESVKNIADYAFCDCSNLTGITLPEGLTSIGEYAFKGCSSITSITIPESVTNIGGYAFNGCSSLTSITLPKSVTSIGDNAFYDCSNLTSVTIPDGVTSIGKYTFYNCSRLASVTIPEGVTSIGWYAFSGCSSLTNITYNGTVSEWDAIIKSDEWHSDTLDYVIYCTDGTIAKDGTVTYN